jgi:hypothetical protein
MSGVGKTKLIAVSAYDMTLVARPRTPNKDESLEGTETVDDIPAVVWVWMLMKPSELDEAAVDDDKVDAELGRLGEVRL